MLDPKAFERSIDAYLDSLTAEDLRNAVLRSIKRMNGEHRSQLALFLGHDVGGHPIDDVGGSAVDERELRSFIESCPLLRERFAAFLRDNPRAAYALGEAAAAQLLPDIEEPQAHEAGAQRKRPLRTAAIAAAAVALAVLPMVGQYVHQRGMLAGLDQISLAPAPISEPVQPAAAHAIVSHRAVRHVSKAPPKPRAAAVHRRVAAAPHETAQRPIRHVAVHHTHAPKHVAIESSWKFDRRVNPYFSHRWHEHTVAYVPGATRFSGRAQLLVSSYLADVVAGNTTRALEHLGLPAGADVSNIRESAILERNSHVRVVAVHTQPDGSAKVEADISGRKGEYFEVFYVHKDGPAVRIGDRYYIPVDRTAEERAARLLATDGH